MCELLGYPVSCLLWKLIKLGQKSNPRQTAIGSRGTIILTQRISSNYLAGQLTKKDRVRMSGQELPYLIFTNFRANFQAEWKQKFPPRGGLQMN
jgi:hypothetical protein